MVLQAIKVPVPFPSLYQNSLMVLQERRAVGHIAGYFRAKRIRYTTLIKRAEANLDKILRLQSYLRGHFARSMFAAEIARIRRVAPTKTKKF